MRTLFSKALALHHPTDRLVGKGTARKSSSGGPCLQAPQKWSHGTGKGSKIKTREFKRSGCLFIDLGLVRAASSITVVQKFLLMAPSARVPIWFVFATFGLGHLFGNNVRICQGQIEARIGCLTPCSKGREMCVCV